MSWTVEIREKALVETVVGLVESVEGLFDERYSRARSAEMRLAEVLSEPDIIELILGRIARNALGQPVKY